MMAEKPTKSSKLSKYRYMTIKMTPHVLGNIIYQFEHMERFKDFMFSAIETEKKSIKDFHEKESKVMSEDEREYYYEMVSEDYFLVEDFFTEVSLYSFIMILYSYVESGLNALCRVKYSDKVRQQKKDNLRAADEGMEQRPLLDIKLKDIAGKGIINSAKKYLKKVFYVDFNSVKEEWDELNGLRRIRNAIVHNNGYAREDAKKDGKINQNINNDRIEIKDNGQIIIKQEYADFILKQAINFFKKIDI